MECGEGRSSGVVMRRQNEEQMFHVKHSAAKRELPREWVAKQELPRGGVAWRDFVRVGCECALGAGRVFAEVVRVAAHGAVPGGLRIGGGCESCARMALRSAAERAKAADRPLSH